MRFSVLMTLSLLLAGCSQSGPKPVDHFAGWQVATLNAGKSDRLCYATSAPLQSEGTIRSRAARPYLMVTLRSSGKLEISTAPGYRFMPGSKVELAIGTDMHSLFHQDTVAWARSDAEDSHIIEGIKTADSIEVRGVSRDGLTSIDHYAPKGFAAAVARVRELCP